MPPSLNPKEKRKNHRVTEDSVVLLLPDLELDLRSEFHAQVVLGAVVPVDEVSDIET
jgi:hypothetical protein